MRAVICKLLPLWKPYCPKKQDRMIRQLMEPLFQSSPLPNDACTTALLGLITALQEKLMTKQEESVLITFQPDPKQQYGFDLQDHEYHQAGYFLR